jgi:hypothetical protein
MVIAKFIEVQPAADEAGSAALGTVDSSDLYGTGEVYEPG